MTKRSRITVISVCCVAAALYLIRWAVNYFSLKEDYYHYRQCDRYHHVLYYDDDDMLTDFTDEETKRIAEAFGIIIPEAETEIGIMTFANVETDYHPEKFIIEFDNISDRERFFEMNENNPDKKENVVLSGQGIHKDKNGEYNYYFCFYTAAQSDFSSERQAVAKLYRELKEVWKS